MMLIQLQNCSIFQLCQLSKKAPDDERNHDHDIAKAPNIVDGNVQASWKRERCVEAEMSVFPKIDFGDPLPTSG